MGQTQFTGHSCGYMLVREEVIDSVDVGNGPNGVILTRGYDVPYNYTPLTIRFFPLPKMRVGLKLAHQHSLVQEICLVLSSSLVRNFREQKSILRFPCEFRVFLYSTRISLLFHLL